MLDYLRVENFAVVEKVELEFSNGLNVLTGETGAGKSILIGAVGCFLKKKVAENTIRSEDKKLIVEAMFSQDDEEFVLRREVGKKKSQAFINDRMVPFNQLKEKAEGLFNIYGQNEHIFLLNPSNHRLFLDAFCGNGPILERLAKAHGALKEAVGELEALKKKNEKAAEQMDFLNFRISEIEELKMEPGDDAKLQQQAKILSSAEEILSRSGTLVREFYQSDRSVYNTVAENLKNLDFLQKIYPELAAMKEEVTRFYNLLPELSATLSNVAGHVEYNEDELNRCEEKLLKLKRLKIKYHLELDGLLHKLVELKAEKEQLRNMDFSIKDKQKEVDRLLDAYKVLNKELRERRKKKTGPLNKTIEKELEKLEMKKARFDVRMAEKEPDINNISEKGTDSLEFYFAGNPGQPPGRIRDIASGGELSRLMLVLKSIRDTDHQATYIFDEVDAGIGGKTAEFVGEKLRRISRDNQVICISHLPQIASFADTHFLITKTFKESETFSNVLELDGEERVKEIGRLMAGSAVGDDVLKAAQRLIEKNKG